MVSAIKIFRNTYHQLPIYHRLMASKLMETMNTTSIIFFFDQINSFMDELMHIDFFDHEHFSKKVLRFLPSGRGCGAKNVYLAKAGKP